MAFSPEIQEAAQAAVGTTAANMNRDKEIDSFVRKFVAQTLVSNPGKEPASEREQANIIKVIQTVAADPQYQILEKSAAGALQQYHDERRFLLKKYGMEASGSDMPAYDLADKLSPDDKEIFAGYVNRLSDLRTQGRHRRDTIVKESGIDDRFFVASPALEQTNYAEQEVVRALRAQEAQAKQAQHVGAQR